MLFYHIYYIVSYYIISLIWHRHGELASHIKFKLKEASMSDHCYLCWKCYKFSYPTSLAGYKDEELVGMVTDCGHCFYFDCLWDWLNIHTSCPHCNQVIAMVTDDTVTGIPLSVYWQLMKHVENSDSPCWNLVPKSNWSLFKPAWLTREEFF